MSDAACNGSAMVDLPFSDQYLASLSTGYLVALCLMGMLSLAMLALYVEELVFFLQNLHNWKPKDKAIYLLGLYPVYGVTSFIALLVPRSSVLDDLVASLYLSVCVYMFVTMLIGHFGGAHKMVRRLSHQPISLRTPPLCCCCICLPNIQVTSGRLQALELVVLQYAVFKPILSFIGTVLWMDGKFVNEDLSKTAAYTWINFLNLLSTTAALYGFAMTYGVSHMLLERMCIKPKFICLQLVIIFANFQHVIIGVFVKIGVIPCDPPLSAKANGDRWHHIFLIAEMFVISLFARTYYRRHVGDLPPDDMILPDTENASTEVTATLTRQGAGGVGGVGERGTHYGSIRYNHSSTAVPGGEKRNGTTSTGTGNGSVYAISGDAGYNVELVTADDNSSSSSDEVPMIVSLESAVRNRRGGIPPGSSRTVATSTDDLLTCFPETDMAHLRDLVSITSPQHRAQAAGRVMDDSVGVDRIEIIVPEDSTDA